MRIPWSVCTLGPNSQLNGCNHSNPKFTWISIVERYLHQSFWKSSSATHEVPASPWFIWLNFNVIAGWLCHMLEHMKQIFAWCLKFHLCCIEIHKQKCVIVRMPYFKVGRWILVILFIFHCIFTWYKWRMTNTLFRERFQFLCAQHNKNQTGSTYYVTKQHTGIFVLQKHQIMIFREEENNKSQNSLFVGDTS